MKVQLADNPEGEFVSDNDSKFRDYQLHHVGVADGLEGSNTTRVNLWWDGEATPRFMQFLDRQCDALGIEGVESVVKVDGETHIKGQLVIDRKVTVTNAASLWISAFNTHIAEQPQMVIDGFIAGGTIKDAMAVDSPENFAWNGSAGDGSI